MIPLPAENDAQAGPGALDAAVLRVLDAAGKAVGMGFLVADDVALTCAHVVSAVLGSPPEEPLPPSAEIHVDLPLLPGTGEGPTAVSARVVHWTPRQATGAGDIAVLRLSAPLPGARPVRLVAARAEHTWGHPVRAFGLPEGRPGGVWHAGVLRGQQAQGWVQADLAGQGYPVSRGFSGSPVWDERLAGVVGMTVVADTGQPPASYLIPTSRLAEAWPDLREVLLPAPPFRGLAAFQESDARVFHSRRAESDDVAAMLSSHRWVSVVGPSGSGKSSLAMAGVAPLLRAGGTVPVVLRPAAGRSPLSALAAALSQLLDPDLSELSRLERVPQLAEELARPGGLAHIIGRLPEPESGERRLLVVIDQFEELLAAEPEAAGKLADVLCTGALPPSVRVLATLRADFLEAALAHPRLGPYIGQQVYTLPPIGPGRLREVVTAPLDAIPGVGYEENLPDRILADAGHAPGALPLLELTLDLLWQQRRGGVLTHDAYEQLGHVSGALRRHADRVWAEYVPEEDEAAARRLLVRLIRIPPGPAPATRRMVPSTELDPAERQIAQRLAGARLLVTGRTAEGTETVELAHDALITGWPLLAGWITRDRSFLAWFDVLRHDMERWETGGRRTDLLPNAAALTAARPWLRTRGDELSTAARDYLERGRVHHRAQARRRHALVSGLALTVVLTLVLGTLLHIQQQHSRRQAELADSRALARASQDQTDSDPALSAMLAIAAYHASPTLEARNELLHQYLREIPTGRIASGFLGRVGDFRVSRDGEVLLVRSTLDRATLFVHAATGRMRTLRLPSGDRMYPLVSADGTRTGAVDADGSVDWYTVTPDADRITGPVHHLPPVSGLPRPYYSGNTATVSSSAEASPAGLSPDGRFLVYATPNCLVWRNLDTGKGGTLPEPPHHGDSVWFGPDDRTLLTDTEAGHDRSRVTAVDRTTGKARRVTPAADQKLISGDGTAVAVCHRAGDHNKLSVYRVRDGRQQGRTYTDRSLDCSMQATDATGRRILLGAGIDGQTSLRLLDVGQGKVVSRFPASGTPAQLISAHGRTLLVTADDTRIGYTEVPSAPGTVKADQTILTPDGDKTIAVVSGGDCSIQKRPAVGGAKLLARAQRPKPCWAPQQGDQLVLDSSGKLLAERDGEDTVSVRTVSTLRRTTRVTTAASGHQNTGTNNFACFFDRRGHLVTVSGTLVQRWDAHTGRQLDHFDTEVFHPGTDDNGSLELSVGSNPAPDSISVVKWGDPAVHVVNLATGHTTTGPRLGKSAHALRFDPSGRYFAVLRSGGTIELWQRDPLRREVGPLPSVIAEDGVYVAQFIDGQGRYLLGTQNALRVYRVGRKAYEDSYEFGDPSGAPNAAYEFLSASKNGRAVIYADAHGTGGPLLLDPAAWQRALCRAVGYREFSAAERQSLPVHVPAQPVCPE